MCLCFVLFSSQMIKTCFNILKRLIESWGGNGGMPLFRDFIYKYVIPACFLAPLQKTFDLTDAQTVMVNAPLSQPQLT